MSRYRTTKGWGDVGDGWKVSITTLMNERLAVGDAQGPDFDEAMGLVLEHSLGGEAAIKDSDTKSKLADWYTEMSGLKYT